MASLNRKNQQKAYYEELKRAQEFNDKKNQFGELSKT